VVSRYQSRRGTGAGPVTFSEREAAARRAQGIARRSCALRARVTRSDIAVEALKDPGTALRLAEGAFDHWDRQYTPQRGLQELEGAYRAALAVQEGSPSVSFLKPPDRA
jgi:hypothetical protein